MILREEYVKRFWQIKASCKLPAMDSEPVISAPQPRRLIARALAWGIGFGIGCSIAFGALYYYVVKPKSWDTRSIRVQGSKAEGIGQLGKRTDSGFTLDAIGTSFTVDLKNTTGADISLPTSLRIMETTKGTGALHESPLKLSKDYFLPAGHTVSVSIDDASLCTTDTKTDKCFETKFKDQADIVIFDESSKLEIHIPIPAFTPEKDGVPRFIKYPPGN